MTRNRFAPKTYTLFDELLASPRAPLPDKSRLHQLTIMWQGLANLETGANPHNNDWRVVSDAVNLMETFVKNGPWADCTGAMNDIPDPTGLLQDAVMALAMAGKRKVAGGPLRLDGPGIQAARAVLENYADLLDLLPHRTVVRCHRMTERRMLKIMHGIRQAHDVEVMAL
jgi:hypothetical protein